MFTLIAIGILLVVFVVVERRQKRDTEEKDLNILHARQDLRLIAYLLFGVVIMLGLIADRIH
jgi:hypothetical protein